MPKSARIGLAAGVFLAFIVVAIVVVTDYWRQDPPNVNFVSGHQAGQPVNLTVQTLGHYGHGSHPDWVSYMVESPAGKWVHSTLWQLPEHTRVNVTLYEYDTGSPLRNQVWGGVTGTLGDAITVNGKSTSLVDSNSGNGVAHTFTVPALGLNVPLDGVSSSAKNICAYAPCQLSSSAHNIIKFSFMTTSPGQYRWQCFVPCGAGYLDGNGGPMQTNGYMGGFLKVLS